jgi:hypothetical protein
MLVVIIAGVARSYNANGFFEVFSPKIAGDKFRTDTSHFFEWENRFCAI